MVWLLMIGWAERSDRIVFPRFPRIAWPEPRIKPLLFG